MVVALEPRRAWQRTTLRGPFSSSPALYLERLQKLPLGRDSCCQGREQRGHSQSECAVTGMGVPAMSPSPPATSLAEDLPWHCPPPVPTPTSSPCLSPDPKAPPSLATGNTGAVQAELPRTIAMLPQPARKGGKSAAASRLQLACHSPQLSTLLPMAGEGLEHGQTWHTDILNMRVWYMEGRRR